MSGQTTPLSEEIRPKKGKLGPNGPTPAPTPAQGAAAPSSPFVSPDHPPSPTSTPRPPLFPQLEAHSALPEEGTAEVNFDRPTWIQSPPPPRKRAQRPLPSHGKSSEAQGEDPLPAHAPSAHAGQALAKMLDMLWAKKKATTEGQLIRIEELGKQLEALEYKRQALLQERARHQEEIGQRSYQWALMEGGIVALESLAALTLANHHLSTEGSLPLYGWLALAGSALGALGVIHSALGSSTSPALAKTEKAAGHLLASYGLGHGFSALGNMAQLCTQAAQATLAIGQTVAAHKRTDMMSKKADLEGKNALLNYKQQDLEQSITGEMSQVNAPYAYKRLSRFAASASNAIKRLEEVIGEILSSSQLAAKN